MKTSSIKYDPYKTLEQIASDSGLSVEAVRRYIKVRNIDRKCDDEIIKYQKVKMEIKNNPHSSIPEIAKSLSMAVGTVRKYADMRFPPRPKLGKISIIQQTNTTLYVAVSDSQNQILRAILTTYLNQALTYDCDLTYGRGYFYNESVPSPRFVYDINPQKENVKSLDAATNLPNGCFNSVVIDLPCSIIRPTVRRTKQNYAAFDNVEALYSTYTSMIGFAFRLLKEEGILVFKCSDFSLDGQPVWISDWTVANAVKIGFTLADKYIYIDRKAIEAVTSSQRRKSVPTHAYFFVFRKCKRG